MPGKSLARAGVVAVPTRLRSVDPATSACPRSPSDLALDAWSRPSAWRWLEGRWALSGTLLGVPVAPAGDTLRLSVGADGVVFESRPGCSLPIITFECDGRPSVHLEGMAGEGSTAALRAVAATRRSVTFQDVISAGSPVPAVLRVTLRRAGPNIFHIVGDTAVGPSPVPMLAYTALKLNGRG